MFETRAKLETAKGGNWKLLEELRYYTKRGHLIRIPKGFLCDLASIPRIFRPILSVNGDHREAAILHDWLYYKKGHAALSIFTREECDKLFLEAMLESGVSKAKSYLMFAGVRVGGWVAWNR